MPRSIDHAQRRATLVDATLRLVRETGTRAVSIRAVAAAIGGSTTMVTHYFRNRRDLLHAAVAWALEDRRRVLTDAADSLDPLRSILLRSIDADDAALWAALLAAAADREPDLAAPIEDFDTWWAELLERFVTAAGVDDPRTVTDTLGAVVDGLILTVEADGWNDERRIAAIDRALTALVPHDP